MDNQRLFLFVALSFVLLLLWQAWIKDYGPEPQATAPPATTQTATPADTGADLPAAPAEPVQPELAVPEEIALQTAQQVVEGFAAGHGGGEGHLASGVYVVQEGLDDLTARHLPAADLSGRFERSRLPELRHGPIMAHT